jgi:hypothetical protein
MLRYILIVLAMTLSPGLATVALTRYVDPWQFFGPAAYATDMNRENARFWLPGVAKHLDYDSVLIGTSLTINSSVAVLDRSFGAKFVKLSMNGSRLPEQSALLRVALQSHPATRRVLWGIDQYVVHVPPDIAIPETEFPRYLYGSLSPAVVENYLLSWDAIKQSVAAWRQGAPPNLPDFELTTVGQGIEKGGCTTLREKYLAYRTRLEQERATMDYNRASAGLTEQAYLELLIDIDTTRIETNIATYVEPLVAAYPATVFYLFYPPYSFAEDYAHAQLMPISLAYKRLLRSKIEALAARHSNVRIFDFQNDVVQRRNIDGYWDLLHYVHEEANRIDRYMAAHDNYPTNPSLLQPETILQTGDPFAACGN